MPLTKYCQWEYYLNEQNGKRTSHKNSLSENFISHDWWCCQIISGAGGEVIFDKNKTVRYRQHKNNLIGKNNGFREIKSRIQNFIWKVKIWSDVNLKNLMNFRNLLLMRILKFLKAHKSQKNKKYL